jgi:hypothetical protein
MTTITIIQIYPESAYRRTCDKTSQTSIPHASNVPQKQRSIVAIEQNIQLRRPRFQCQAARATKCVLIKKGPHVLFVTFHGLGPMLGSPYSPAIDAARTVAADEKR